MRRFFSIRSGGMAMALVSLLAAAPLAAKDIYVSPESGESSATPDGSRAAPFPGIASALRSGRVSVGDRVVLRAGHYGTVNVAAVNFPEPIDILPEEPGRVHADKIIVRQASGLRFKGIAVWPRETGQKQGNLVTTFADTDNIHFEGLDIRGRADAPEGYLSWSKSDWLSLEANGARLEGTRNSISDSRVTGVIFGITTLGDGAEVRRNRVIGFGGDAMRGLGNGSVFADNLVRDCVKISKNHDDGFQSWATKKDETGRKVVRDLLIERNVIMEWLGPADHPLRCVLQGIGLFDGVYENFTIRNNLVAVSAWHGIALYAGDKSRIGNNTVVHPSGGPAELPWIMLGKRKNGPEKGTTLVRNNVSMAYRGMTGATRHNVLAKFPATVFADPGRLDFRPKAGSALINSGDPAAAPRLDLTGHPRDNRPDMGALEMR